MKAALQNEIVRQFAAGMSQRQIARHLQLSRHTVARVLADWEADAQARTRRRENSRPPCIGPANWMLMKPPCVNCWPAIPT